MKSINLPSTPYVLQNNSSPQGGYTPLPNGYSTTGNYPYTGNYPGWQQSPYPQTQPQPQTQAYYSPDNAQLAVKLNEIIGCLGNLMNTLRSLTENQNELDERLRKVEEPLEKLRQLGG